jgi:hypothetical protein
MDANQETFAGWLRPSGGRWRKLVTAGSESEAWEQLLAHDQAEGPIDLRVVGGDVDPNRPAARQQHGERI